jgi:DNA-binding response OmpR family regulator
MLIVEDERETRSLISDILEEEGFLVDRAHEGESAIKKIKRKKYDFMILDYKLPGISGLEVLEEANKIRPKLRVIMISAYGNDYVKAKAKELGAFCFLDKPIAIKELLQSVKERLADEKK